MAGEIAVVLIGGAFNLALFVMMSVGMYTAQQVLDSFPASVSRIMFAGGLATILDPILVFIVDASIQNWNGDAFKLYNYFQVWTASIRRRVPVNNTWVRPRTGLEYLAYS